MRGKKKIDTKSGGEKRRGWKQEQRNGRKKTDLPTQNKTVPVIPGTDVAQFEGDGVEVGDGEARGTTEGDVVAVSVAVLVFDGLANSERHEVGEAVLDGVTDRDVLPAGKEGEADCDGDAPNDESSNHSRIVPARS